jgi:hypothetical protein
MGEGLMLPCPKIVRGQQYFTPKQRAYAQEFTRERIAAMLSTAAISDQEAEEHLHAAYRAAGMKPPATIRRFDSPRSFFPKTIGWLNMSNMERTHLLYNRGEHVRNRVGESMWNSVENTMDCATTIEGDQRATILLFSVIASMEGIMWTEVWRSTEVSLSAYSCANWLNQYRFLHEVFEENEPIHLARFNELVSGYWLGSHEALLVRKPVILQYDERGRLHNANGPCLQYRDGWVFYAWHGVHVREKLIMHPEHVTRQEWMLEPNAEVRRVIQERLGMERFIELMGGRCIERGKRGNLIEIDLGDDPERVAHYVQVQDSSTQRHYYLRVPPSITRADEAIAWTFGLNVRDYQPGQET